jgi:hypothetical protein
MENDEIRARYEKEVGPYRPFRSPDSGMSSKEFFLILLIVILVGFMLLVLASATIFEDGSFILGPLSGCLPWGLCNEHVYSGLNAGIAWSWGGLEWRGDPGLFFCDGTLPALAADC